MIDYGDYCDCDYDYTCCWSARLLERLLLERPPACLLERLPNGARACWSTATAHVTSAYDYDYDYTCCWSARLLERLLLERLPACLLERLPKGARACWSTATAHVTSADGLLKARRSDES